MNLGCPVWSSGRGLFNPVRKKPLLPCSSFPLFQLHTSQNITFPKAKHFFQFINFINWRIIVLQCCIGFCHTSTTESAIGIHEPSLLNLPPTPHPIPSLSVVTDTGFIFLCHTANSHWPSILPMGMYIFQCSSLNLSHPLLPSHSVHKSVFYTCISIAALQKGLSVPFF